MPSLKDLNDHAELISVVVAILIALGGVVSFFIKRKFFQLEKIPDISIKESKIDGNFVAIKDTSIDGDFIGGDRITLQINFHNQLPNLQKNAKEAGIQTCQDINSRKKVEKLMKRHGGESSKKELWEIYNKTNDEILKVQIALIFGCWFVPLEDDPNEIIKIIDNAIIFTEAAKSKPQQGTLLAYKGVILTEILFEEQSQLYFLAIKSGKNISLEKKNELIRKSEYANLCFSEAEKIIEETNSFEEKAAVYIEIGSSSARSALKEIGLQYMQKRAAESGIFIYITDPQNEKKEREKMKKAFKKAEEVYRSAASQLPCAGELEITNVRYNYANALRLLGAEERKEAKDIISDVILIAEKHGDQALILKARTMEKDLKGERKVPNYLAGESLHFSI